MKATAGKTNNLLSWNKIPSADGYRIYGGECGSTMKLIKTVSAGTQSWNHSGLKAGKAYRYCVKAYRIVNGTETVTKTSNTVHSITASSKFTNAKSVTVSETSVALQVGESKNLGAKVVAADANRTLLTSYSRACIQVRQQQSGNRFKGWNRHCSWKRNLPHLRDSRKRSIRNCNSNCKIKRFELSAEKQMVNGHWNRGDSP